MKTRLYFNCYSWFYTLYLISAVASCKAYAHTCHVNYHYVLKTHEFRRTTASYNLVAVLQITLLLDGLSPLSLICMPF